MMMIKPNLFLPITKIDEEKRLVYGVATAEEVDKTNEIFDYDTSKPYIQAWSQEYIEKTDGQSCGNLRAMHKAVSAGKLVQLDFDDVNKTVTVCAKVVDDAEWKKVAEGVYTGFSYGGKALKKWADSITKAIRYTLKPNELSLADSPCVPSAIFYDVVKVDGTTEKRQRKAIAQGGENVGDSIKKGLYSVQTLAGLLQSLGYLQSDTAWEADYEGDGSPLPAKLKQLAADMAEVLKEMVGEEADELIAGMTKAEPAGDIQKAGARNSKSDQQKIQQVHDHAVSLGASCDSAKCTGNGGEQDVNKLEGEALTQVDDQIKKTFEPLNSEVQKIAAVLPDIQKALSNLAAMEERLAKVEGTPIPAKTAGKAIVIQKGEDIPEVKDQATAVAKADALYEQIQKQLGDNGGAY